MPHRRFALRSAASSYGLASQPDLPGVDQRLQRQWRPGVYARYVDDLVVFDNSLDRLREMKEAIRRQLWDLRLDLNTGKSRIYRVADGVTFLGWRIFPDRTRLVL
jgi:RNA-directed DNA polymerase